MYCQPLYVAAVCGLAGSVCLCLCTAFILWLRARGLLGVGVGVFVVCGCYPVLVCCMCAHVCPSFAFFHAVWWVCVVGWCYMHACVSISIVPRS